MYNLFISFMCFQWPPLPKAIFYFLTFPFLTPFLISSPPERLIPSPTAGIQYEQPIEYYYIIR